MASDGYLFFTPYIKNTVLAAGDFFLFSCKIDCCKRGKIPFLLSAFPFFGWLSMSSFQSEFSFAFLSLRHTKFASFLKTNKTGGDLFFRSFTKSHFSKIRRKAKTNLKVTCPEKLMQMEISYFYPRNRAMVSIMRHCHLYLIHNSRFSFFVYLIVNCKMTSFLQVGIVFTGLMMAPIGRPSRLRRSLRLPLWCPR